MPQSNVRRWFGIEIIEVSLAEKLVATFGGGRGLLALVGISGQMIPGAGGAAVVAALRASAVLLFAAPPTHDEVVQALRSLDSFVDISEADLLRLFRFLQPHDPRQAVPPAKELEP